MRKILSLVVVLLIAFSFFGCYSVKIVAPPVSESNSNVRLLTAGEPAAFKETHKNIYVLWGLVPINRNKTDKMISENGLNEVRVETKHTFLDYFISLLGNFISISVNTSVVEGNSKK
jgi:hypothetical protein